MLNWADYRRHVEALMAAALAAADPAEAVRRHLSLEDDLLQLGPRRIELEQRARIFVVGAGKAGAAMGGAAAQILGRRLTAGVVAVPSAPSDHHGPIEWIESGHPLPDEGSLEAGRRIRRLLEDGRPGDIVLVLLSGGGSALLELPRPGLTLPDLRASNELLMRAGASIEELNTVRQHLSQIKGGGLANMARPAQVLALILSDVVGDKVEVIASGPTARPAGTRQQALDIIQRYELSTSLPGPVLRALEIGPDGELGRAQALENTVIASNRTAAEAALEAGRGIGFNSRIITTEMEGQARRAGALAAGLAKTVLEHGDPLPAPACLILGGETTVKIQGDGIGGRNQELALAAAIELDGLKLCALASFDTDGIDGPTPAAGAVVTGEAASAARSRRLDPDEHLARSDSHTLLSAIGATLTTKPTGTNVNDLVFVLVYPDRGG